MPPDTLTTPAPARSLTVTEFAQHYRVGEDKVRAWINRGELAAVNVAGSLCGRPQLRITPAAITAFERLRSAGTPPAPRRRKKKTAKVDYFPDPPRSSSAKS